MANHKTLASIEKKIKLTQQQLSKAKIRYDRLAAELLALNKEKDLKQARIIAEALARSNKSMDELMTFLRC